MTASTDTTVQADPAYGPRVFWRYWSGMAVSQVGDAVTSVALPLIAVQRLGASSLQISLITAAGFVAWLLIGLPAGVIVHRLPLRGTQVAMDLLRAAALASIPLVAWLGDLRLWQLVVVALVIGLAGVVFDVGNAAFLPSIVSKSELVARNSLTSGTNAVTQVGGPSLGGVLVQSMGGVAALLVDVASYVCSAVLLQALPRPPRQVATPGGPSAYRLIGDGWRYVTGHRVIRPGVAAATSINFVCGGLVALTPVFLVRTLGASAGLVGLLMASEGVGSLLGALLTPRLVARSGSARALLLGSFIAPVAAVLMPLAGHRWGLVVFAVGNAGFAGGVVVMSIVMRTHRQTTVPADLLPRVMATVRFISWGAIPVGAVFGGLVAHQLGNRGAFWVICLLAAVTPAILLSSPIRSRRDLD
jgi:MFS family permease